MLQIIAKTKFVILFSGEFSMIFIEMLINIDFINFGGSLLYIALINAALQSSSQPFNCYHENALWQLYITKSTRSHNRQNKVIGTVFCFRSVNLSLFRGKLELLLIEELFCILRTAVAFRYHGVPQRLLRLIETPSSSAVIQAK